MYGVDCHNIQHEGGVTKKNVKDTVGDTSRTKIFKLGEYGQKLRRLPTIQFAHDFHETLEPLFQKNTVWFPIFFSRPTSLKTY